MCNDFVTLHVLL